MSEGPRVSGMRYSLFSRIMGTVFALVLLMYLVTLAVLGMLLKERAQQHLGVNVSIQDVPPCL